MLNQLIAEVSFVSMHVSLYVSMHGIYLNEFSVCLLMQGPSTQREAGEKCPLPDCAFIQENVLNQQPVQ
jgi:hypothetical protein